MSISLDELIKEISFISGRDNCSHAIRDTADIVVEALAGRLEKGETEITALEVAQLLIREMHVAGCYAMVSEALEEARGWCKEPITF